MLYNRAKIKPIKERLSDLAKFAKKKDKSSSVGDFAGNEMTSSPRTSSSRLYWKKSRGCHMAIFKLIIHMYTDRTVN